MDQSSTTVGRPHRELVITRLFNAPRELVFKAWTEPKHLAEWWGPKGFTNPVCEVDAVTGGAIRIVMRGPDGAEYPMRGIFQEFLAPERLVFTNVAVDAQDNPILEGLTSVTFEEENGKTRMTVTTAMNGLIPETARMLEGMEMGWNMSLDKLHVLLESGSGGDAGGRPEPGGSFSGREITSSRVFDAPRELVFDMWTSREHIGHWFGPRGFTLTIHEMDVRPGGYWRFIMHGPDGVDYQNEILYREVERPERLVYDHISWPGFRMTVGFAELGAKTRLAAQLLFDSAELRDKVASEGGAVEGLEQTLDRLAEQLA